MGNVSRLARGCLATLSAAALLAVGGAPADAGGPAHTAANPIFRYDRFQAVARSDAAVVAVGAFGAILASGDQGNTWQRTELPGRPPLIDVAACGDGFAVLDMGRKVWFGGPGQGWQAVDLPTPDVPLDLTCDAAGHVWAIGARGAVFESADRGITWTDHSTGEDVQLLNIAFDASGFGIISGEFGTVLTTTDSGRTWQNGEPVSADFYPQAMHLGADRQAWLVGLGGTIFATADGGATWERRQAPTEAPLYGVVAQGASLLVVGASGVALRETGATWQAVELPTGHFSDIRGIVAVDHGVVLAGSGGALLLHPFKS